LGAALRLPGSFCTPLALASPSAAAMRGPGVQTAPAQALAEGAAKGPPPGWQPAVDTDPPAGRKASATYAAPARGCPVPARQRTSRLLTLAYLLIALAGAAAAARAATLPSADPAAELLATQLEAELARQRHFTAAFASDPIFRHHEHWYRPWQDNAIVMLMDRTVANVDGLLLTQLVDLDGQLVAINAHDSAKLPLATQTLYIDDYRQRPWFLALAAAGAKAQPRIDGPAEDPDVLRVYPDDETCLRVTVPVFAGERLVALLSHCLRFAPLAARVEDAASAPGAEYGTAVALLDADGRVLAGGEPALGAVECDVVDYPIALGTAGTWTLRAYQPHAAAIQRQWQLLLAALPSRAELAAWPGRIFTVSALAALLLLGLGLLKRERAQRRPTPAHPARRGPVLPQAHRQAPALRGLSLGQLLLRQPWLRRLVLRPARPPRRPPMAAPRGPLTPAEKAYELLAAILGTLQGTLHALADSSEALAEHRRDPLLGRGPGSTLHALRRAAGLAELLRGLENHAQHCRENAALAPAVKQAVDVFARLGHEIGELIDPLAETEQRLARLPRSGLRASADTHCYQELTGSLHRTVGVMTALQGALGRLPQRVLCDAEAAKPSELVGWQEAVAELQDLLLTLARQLGATRKLLELLPAATGAVVAVRDVSAAGLREAGTPPAGREAAAARPSPRPGGSAPAPVFELLSQRRGPSGSTPAPPRFEILGGRPAAR